jgi:uncharacterized protein (DUF1697 family)
LSTSPPQVTASILPDAAVPKRSKPTTYAALLRGINLGSHKRIAMADLRALVEGLGCSDVRTYVQSGNAVFRSDLGAADAARAIERTIQKELDLEVTVVIRTARQLRDLVSNNPFARSKSTPKTLYVTFLAGKPDRARVRKLVDESFEPERFEIAGEDVYLDFPDGYGRVKLSNATLERRLGVTATTRNWRTVTALADLTAG